LKLKALSSSCFEQITARALKLTARAMLCRICLYLLPKVSNMQQLSKDLFD